MELEERITRLNAYVREADLPYGIRAATVPNSDGTFDVYVNRNISEEAQRSTLEHELNHIESDHFYRPTSPIQVIEAEASKGGAA